MLKPLYRYFREPEYRAYLRVQQNCRHKPNERVTIWLDGYVVEGSDGPALLHQYEEIVQRKSFDFKPVNEHPLIYVCGANIGLEVLHLEQLYPGAQIKAYEADPELFAILKSNIERNDSKAEAFNVAISDQNGSARFQSDGKLGGKIADGKDTGSVEVTTIRLSEILAGERTIDLLIMDIEGAENKVLPDCGPSLNKVRQLFVEWHSDEKQPQGLDKILHVLQENGFRYRLNNNLGSAPFRNAEPENGFDAMVEIYASRTHA